MTRPEDRSRENEWFALRRGPRRLRAVVNMLFIPYTLMNASYVVIGSVLPALVHWDRVAALVVVYVLAVGLSAHALDAMGPNKPWGDALSKRQLAVTAAVSLVPALAIGAYYSILYTPWLLAVGLVELFFLFAYNLDLFESKFHSKAWFALSWGFLPVLAGYVAQTDSVSFAVILAGVFGFATSYLEANASRPYKELKMTPGAQGGRVTRLERTLEGLVGSTILVAVAMAIARILG